MFPNGYWERVLDLTTNQPPVGSLSEPRPVRYASPEIRVCSEQHVKVILVAVMSGSGNQARLAQQLSQHCYGLLYNTVKPTAEGNMLLNVPQE